MSKTTGLTGLQKIEAVVEHLDAAHALLNGPGLLDADEYSRCTLAVAILKARQAAQRVASQAAAAKNLDTLFDAVRSIEERLHHLDGGADEAKASPAEEKVGLEIVFGGKPIRVDATPAAAERLVDAIAILRGR